MTSYTAANSNVGNIWRRELLWKLWKCYT